MYVSKKYSCIYAPFNFFHKLSDVVQVSKVINDLEKKEDIYVNVDRKWNLRRDTMPIRWLKMDKKYDRIVLGRVFNFMHLKQC